MLLHWLNLKKNLSYFHEIYENMFVTQSCKLTKIDFMTVFSFFVHAILFVCQNIKYLYKWFIYRIFSAFSTHVYVIFYAISAAQ